MLFIFIRSKPFQKKKKKAFYSLGFVFRKIQVVVKKKKKLVIANFWKKYIFITNSTINFFRWNLRGSN